MRDKIITHYAPCCAWQPGQKGVGDMLSRWYPLPGTRLDAGRVIINPEIWTGITLLHWYSPCRKIALLAAEDLVAALESETQQHSQLK